VRNLTLGETDSNFSPNKQNLFGHSNTNSVSSQSLCKTIDLKN